MLGVYRDVRVISLVSEEWGYLVEWAIATHGMYKSPFCVGNVHSLSYFQFQAALSVT